MVDVIERSSTLPTALPVNRSIVKIVVERCAAALGLLVLSPALLLVALLIVRDSPGPVFYRQQRRGLDGRVFSICKFRTMTAEASAGAFRQAAPGDARITALGVFLRRWSIDELPQLLNVVIGDMALIGPRPHPLELDEEFRNTVPHYMDRYRVRPGITGLAQVSGHRGPTPTVASMEQRVAHDLRYIETWSLPGDAVIVLRTVFGRFGVGYGS